MSDRLFIFDTTLRDGEQVPGCQLNTVEKIQVAKALETNIRKRKVHSEPAAFIGTECTICSS